ncbi:ATP-binding protein [Oceaniglobus roseus]|uniref:ATP-binding protein n=1 Tax=Oceaniglobus roseus TaxID=1737570 RepID=UPI000C7F46B3|nr:PAS domain-containing hybrid sensor histidine kinase/response regulator [Kandeliimicrobium roseum]
MQRKVREFWTLGKEPIDLFLADAPLMMHSIDRDGILTRVSGVWAAKLGYDPGDMIGRPLVDFMTPDSRHKARQRVLPRFMADGVVHDVEYDFLHRDGHAIPVLLTAVANYTETGEFHRSLAFLFDNSGARRATAVIAQKTRLEVIGNLVGGVAHDFNNLLSVIMGNLELLQDMPDHPDRATMLRDAIGAARRGATLTQQLVAYGRRAQLSPRPHPVGDILDDLAKMLHRLLPANIRLEFGVDPDLPRVMIDRPQLETAILNIVDNAREAMPEGGSIRISARARRLDGRLPGMVGETPAPGPYVELAIRDEGRGMVPDVLERAFDPFFTTKAVGQGSGLGLSMVIGFLQQSDGALRIDSAPGAGTALSIFLPALQVSRKAIRRGAAPDPGHHLRSERPTQILLVEDEADLRRLLAHRLRLSGHGVVEASNGDSAMALLEHGLTPQLILSDVSMPGRVQGPELVRLARARLGEVKTILLSGHAPGDGPEEADPAICRLVKPVSHATLLATIARLTEGGVAPASGDAAGTFDGAVGMG